ncbi:peptide chain release factor 1-like, mitochondrial isoform X2 [Mustelus asterias]
MLIIGRTLFITLNATGSRSRTLSCLAKHLLPCVRRCFQLKVRHGFQRPLSANLPAGTPEPARAFSASVQVVEGLFERSSLQRYLRDLEQEHTESVRRLNSTQASLEGGEEEERVKVLRRRVTELTPVTMELQQLRMKMQDLEDIESLLKDEDADLKKLAESEESSCLETIRALKSKIISLLIPPEEADDNDLILEVTAGVGGQESMLFTAEMFQMYQSYAAYKNWHFEVLEYCHSDLGGLRHATASIDMTINPKELRIETKRASGAGGQHVNTTDSAVRILHIPTGVVAECQQERSQLKNREKSMQMLRAKLYTMKLEEQTNKRYNARKIQIGTKGRSEKIRTYNFPQDRITDHRIGKSLHDLRSFMMGKELLDEMVEELKGLADSESLLELLEQRSPSQQSEHRHQ